MGGMDMKCSCCGKENNSHTNYCEHCGAQIELNDIENLSDSMSLWERFLSKYDYVFNEDTVNMEILFKNEFFIENETDFDKMSSIWLKSLGNALANEFFKGIHKKQDINKGIEVFCVSTISSRKNYEHFYANSSGFRFFIDSVPSHIIKVFEEDQRKTARRDGIWKTIRAVRSLGLSLLTDPAIDFAFGLFNTKDFEKLATDKNFNAYMYAIGYSDYWT